MRKLKQSLERYANSDHEILKICQSPINYLMIYKKNKGKNAASYFPSKPEGFKKLLEDIKNLYRLGATNPNKNLCTYKSISRSELDMLIQGETSIDFFLSTSETEEAALDYSRERHLVRIVEFNSSGVNNIETTKQDVFLIAPEEEEVILIPPLKIKNFRETRKKFDHETGQQIIYYKADIVKDNQIEILSWKLKEERNKIYINVLQGVEKFGSMISFYLKGTLLEDELFNNPEYIEWASNLQRLMFLENMIINTEIGQQIEI